MDEKLLSELQLIFRDRVKFDAETLQAYSRDASVFEITPQVVVVPKNVAELKSLVALIAKRKAKNPNLSITVRAAGTDMTGAAIGESIICDIKELNNIKKIGEDFVILQPGVYYRDLEIELAKHNLFLPSYPASKSLCTVGGMVATNAGGEKNLRFGKTENYVSELKAILADGEEYLIKSLSKEELEEKIKLKNFEGQFYKKLYKLITQNEDLIESAKPKVSKNSTGYALWNVWNPDTKMFNIPQLFIGSQGTLGIITEIKLRVVPIEKFSGMYVAYLYDLKDLAQITNEILKTEPTSIESYDDKTLRLAIGSMSDLAKRISEKENLFKFGASFLGDFGLFAKNLGLPKLALLIEFSSSQEIEIANKMRILEARLKAFDLEGHIVSKDQAQRYWIIRRHSFDLLRGKVKGKQTVPFIDDIIVAPHKLNDFLPKLQQILDEYSNIEYTIAGHLGDGNFHIIPLMNMEDEAQRKVIPELAQKVNELVIEFGGSISAEHGDGLIRGHFLKKMYGKQIFDLFKEVKDIFDKKNLFNPNVKTGAKWSYAAKYIKKHNN